MTTTPDPRPADDDNAAALGLFEQLLKHPGNVLFSPWAVRTAIAMAWAGARGSTARRMEEAMRFPSSPRSFHEAEADRIRRLSISRPGECELKLACALWLDRACEVSPGFLETMTTFHPDVLKRLDLRGGLDACRETINRWAAEKTGNRIREIITPGMLTADARLLLTTAISFKAAWMRPFRPSSTQEQPFHLESGGEREVPLMHLKDDFRHAEGDGYQAVEMHYLGTHLSMLILLPDRHQQLTGLESRLSTALLQDCERRMSVREIDLFVPRFRLDWRLRLNAALEALGLGEAFDPRQADFSGITGHRAPHPDAVFIAEAVQEAVVGVDEEGTEAAAVAGYVLALCARVDLAPTPVFRADRPFLFAIRDRESDVILFLGRCSDPGSTG